MSIEENKALVWSWFEATMSGHPERAMALHRPDCRFFVSGDMPYAGWMDRDGFMAQMGNLKLAGPLTIDFGAMVAEGDRVWLEAEGHGTLQGGIPYNNQYVFMFMIRDGRIIEYKEFIDTLHVYRVIDSAATRGTPRSRERFVTAPSRTITTASHG